MSCCSMVKMKAEDVKIQAKSRMDFMMEAFKEERTEFIKKETASCNWWAAPFRWGGLQKLYTEKEVEDDLNKYCGQESFSTWAMRFSRNRPYWYAYTTCERLLNMANNSGDGFVTVSSEQYEDLFD